MNIQEALNIGLQRQQAGRLAEAEGIYRQILAQQPNHPDALHLLGLIAKEAGRRNEAMQLISQAITVSPNQAQFHCSMGLLLLAEGRSDEAVASIQRSIELNPNLAWSHSDLGYVHMQCGAMEEAIACFDRALALSPTHLPALVLLGKTLNQTQRFAEAVPFFQKALQLCPNAAELHSYLGCALRELGRLDEAVVALRQAMTLWPASASEQLWLAGIFQFCGQYDDAIACLRKLIAAESSSLDVDAYLNLTETSLLKAQLVAASTPIAVESLPPLPYLGDKVVLLRCDCQVRERLRKTGLHGGYAIDPDDGSEIWLKTQLAAKTDPLKRSNLIGQWLQWTRNEAAMADSTCTAWMPDMSQAVADSFRQTAGGDLIEIAGDTAEEIHATLCAMALTPPDTDDKIFAIVSIRNGGVDLLPHWLEHYTRLGVDELLVGIFDDLAGEFLQAIDQCAQRWKFRRFAQHWNAASENETYLQRQTGCRLAGARPLTWIMNTDLDEFHEYPAPIRQITAAAAKAGLYAIHGRFVDRVAADGSLPPVQPHPSLWDQFPIECGLTEDALGGWPQKLMLSRYFVRVRSGHHDAFMTPVLPPPIGAPDDYRVAHFKWHGDLLARLRWGMTQESASQEWKADARRLLALLDQNGGRFDLSDPAMQARKAPSRSW